MLDYAGIGARETPLAVQRAMTGLAVQLRDMGYLLRTGGAIGADEAFATGAENACAIYTPSDVTPEALVVGERFHPKWKSLSKKSKGLIARNGFQVLGDDLKSPVKFVACWTLRGEVVGGTGQALRIAEEFRIPVFNFYFEDQWSKALSFAIATANKEQQNV